MEIFVFAIRTRTVPLTCSSHRILLRLDSHSYHTTRLPHLHTFVHVRGTYSHITSQDNRRARAEHDRDEARTEAARQRKACALATDRAAEAEKTQTALRATVEGLELELVAAYSQVRRAGGRMCDIILFLVIAFGWRVHALVFVLSRSGSMTYRSYPLTSSITVSLPHVLLPLFFSFTHARTLTGARVAGRAPGLQRRPHSRAHRSVRDARRTARRAAARNAGVCVFRRVLFFLDFSCAFQ